MKMNKILSMLAFLMVALFAGNSFAYTAPPKPESGWYIRDQAGKLSTDQLSQLNHKLESISKGTKNEIGALILSSMDGDNIEDVTQATFKAWGVGKAGLDNGVLVVISVAERKSRIQTGKGVEGDLPDLKANDILRNSLAPHLKKGDFYGGLNATFDAITASLESRHATVTTPAHTTQAPLPQTVAQSTHTSEASSGVGLVLFVGSLVFFAIVGFVIFLVKKDEDNKNSLLEEARALREARFRRQREQIELAERIRLDSLRTNISPPVKSTYPTTYQPAPVVQRTVPSSIPTKAVIAGAALGGAALLAEEELRRSNARREREASERRAREASERQAEEDRRRRDREEESRRSSSSFSWSSSDSSSSSSDSGSGFGGGDSGGGGSSSDW